MTGRSAGIGTEERARRKALAVYLVAKLTQGGKETRATIEERLELPMGKLTEMYRQTTRKRWDKATGERTEREPGGLEDWEFALIAGKGYDKGRGVLTDQFIFEFGLGQLVESVQIRAGNGQNVADEEDRDKIKALLGNRREAQRIFLDGLDHVRRGEIPWSKNGRRKKWANATSAERRTSFKDWLDQIERLGCRVLDAEEWHEWFDFADPASTMEQFLWHWCDGWSLGEAPCPPWIQGLDLDRWDNYDALNSGGFLDSLMLITESDMPYTTYHERFKQPLSKPFLQGHVVSHEVTGFSVIDGRLEVEPDFQGDDVGEWLRGRETPSMQAAREADALIDRASRRKSGGVHG